MMAEQDHLNTGIRVIISMIPMINSLIHNRHHVVQDLHLKGSPMMMTSNVLASSTSTEPAYHPQSLVVDLQGETQMFII